MQFLLVFYVSFFPFFPYLSFYLSSFLLIIGAQPILILCFIPAMTTWFCISPTITLVLVAPSCILFNVSYYFISKNLKDPTNYKGYEQVHTTDTDVDQADEENQQKVSRTEEQDSLSRKEKVSIILKMVSLTFVPLYTAYVSYFALIQSVTTTIAYKNAPFRPRDHYQYYIFIFMFGEMVGRCHRTVISFFNPRWLYVPTLIQLWAFSILIFLHLLFAVFEAWYRFLPGVTAILVICLSSGTLGGLLFNNFPEVLRLRFTKREREFGMGYALSPVSTGILSAGVIGLFVEPRLLEHCISTVLDTVYCFTRPESFNDIISHCGTTLP